MDIGTRIRNLRLKNNWTQEELAYKMGYKTKSTINKIELGVNDVSQRNIVKFAEIFETTPAYLMGWTQEDRYNIGAKITELRKQKNKAIYEMADELGIDVKLLEQYEKGIRKIPNEVLERMAIYFETTIDNLISINLETERKHAVITDDEILAKRYKQWQEVIGYAHITDDEFQKILEYTRFIISQREK